MPACCGPDAYAQLFDERNARRDAREYLKKGLDRTGRLMVDEIVRRGVAGASVLEVGGGIGAVEIELLRAGAARATNVEIGLSRAERGSAETLPNDVADLVAGGERGPTDELLAKVAELMEANPELTFAAALARVGHANPDLARAYVAEQQRGLLGHSA